MTRQQIYRDIEQECGLVPTFLKDVPDSTLEHDWETMKALTFADGTLGMKTKHLIGLGVAAAIKCRYCTLFHTEVAKMSGATDDEIHETLRFAMDTTGWSTFVNGLQVDYDQFKDELTKMGEYVANKSEADKKEKVAI